MQKQFCLAAALCGCLVLLGTGCSKTGPAGATGPQGPQGPQGVQGPQGPQGNANVFTDTFTLRNRDWLMSSDYWYTINSSISIGYQTRYHDQSFSKITNDILASGEVMVYFQSSAVDSFQWSPLPFQFIAQGQQYFYNYAYETSPGKVRLHYYYSVNQTGVTLPSLAADSMATHKFKILAVSGTIATGMRQSRIDSSDYAQVMNFLNLH